MNSEAALQLETLEPQAKRHDLNPGVRHEVPELGTEIIRRSREKDTLQASAGTFLRTNEDTSL